MVTCSHEVMDATREAYSRHYKKDLVDAMAGEWAVSGQFKNILTILAKKHPTHMEEDPDVDMD
eukprot:6288898-Pyramimonas_sp.AAC.1